ncbi:MAG: putative DNA binding domain-containing protein [Firmicutes bacterium]|nr:putative DNA binding domain-containing protein [Bacillota bacterium]
MIFETENLEFKSRFTEEIYKEVIAFANTDGGVIYVGIDNEGNVVGLTDVDEEYTRITNGIRDAIMPDVTMFVRFTIQENKVVRITVNEGANKPYYLKSKGLKPSGVYVRQGTSSVPASPEKIRQMIKENDGDVYEEMRSIQQNLTFEAAAGAFKKLGVPFGAEKFGALGMTQNNGGLFTNLALLVSDQCMHTTKVAVFGDQANTVFKDSREFGGSIFSQLEETFSYLRLCNKTSATFKGLERIEKQDYPEEAMREALLNALVHRDYSFSGSIIINVNDQKMEFISIGGLLPGLSKEDIMLGISQPRNRNLAEVFHRLRLIESYGTGIRRIFKVYEGCARQPEIEVTPNAFRLVLPNMNAPQEPDRSKNASVTPQMQRVLEVLDQKGELTEAEIGELLGVKATRAFTVAKQMRDLGLIEARGRGRYKKYIRL